MPPNLKCPAGGPVLPTAEMVLPVRVRKVDPVRPQSLVDDPKLSGMVILQAVVDINGDAGAVSRLSCRAERDGYELSEKKKDPICQDLYRAGEEALAQWKYQSAFADGMPVCVFYTVRMDFRAKH
ncbi:MAG TPA: hypothetical protein VJ826_16495 [Candidatus Polarisedimenticolaceae bacterium]|nr:hypothetical protein [Candidatus Polarisedimenticolaceae bacterium]